MPNITSANRGRRLVVLASVAAVAAALTTIAVQSRSDGTDQRGYAPLFELLNVGSGSPVGDSAPSEPAPVAAVASGEKAVRAFLDAEFAGDSNASYGQLSARDRTAIGSFDDWAATSDDRPVAMGYRITGATARRVDVAADFVPALNETVGLRPASAVISFAVVEEDGGWRVALAESDFRATYPDDRLAVEAATQWVAVVQRCSNDERVALEYEGNLLGTLDLAESLCDAPGTPVGELSGSLDALDDPGLVLSAFGESAADWLRVVSVRGVAAGSTIDVMLAPLGDRWVVVGATGSNTEVGREPPA